jgi:hypothetical protein
LTRGLRLLSHLTLLLTSLVAAALLGSHAARLPILRSGRVAGLSGLTILLHVKISLFGWLPTGSTRWMRPGSGYCGGAARTCGGSIG